MTIKINCLQFANFTFLIIKTQFQFCDSNPRFTKAKKNYSDQPLIISAAALFQFLSDWVGMIITWEVFDLNDEYMISFS